MWNCKPFKMSLKAFKVITVKQMHLQVSREHYLRDDIWSGTPLDSESDSAANKLSATAKHYLVVDTNVALSQVGHGTKHTSPLALSNGPFKFILRLKHSNGSFWRYSRAHLHGARMLERLLCYGGAATCPCTAMGINCRCWLIAWTGLHAYVKSAYTTVHPSIFRMHVIRQRQHVSNPGPADRLLGA